MGREMPIITEAMIIPGPKDLKIFLSLLYKGSLILII